MADKFPAIKALLEKKREEREEKKRMAAAQQQKAKAVEPDTLRDWAKAQTWRMQGAPAKSQTGDSLKDWTFEKQEF